MNRLPPNRAVWGLLLVASAALGDTPTSAPSNPQDLAPTISHQPLSRVNRGDRVVIEATIEARSDKAIYEPTAFVRGSGSAAFSRVPLRNDAGAHWRAELPSALASADFDYYLEAFDEDGNGPGRAGSPDSPFHVVVAAPGPPPPPQVAAPILTPAPSPAPVRTILVESPGPSPRSHVPTFFLGVFGGLLGAASTVAIVGFSIEQANFKAAQSHPGGQFSADNYRLGNYLGQAATGGLIATGLLLGGGIVYMAWPSGSPAPPPSETPQARPSPAPSIASPRATPAPPPAPEAAPQAKPVQPPPAAASPAPTPPAANPANKPKPPPKKSGDDPEDHLE